MTSAGIAAIGERERVGGFALAGVLVVAANDPESVRTAWEALPAEVGVVILTPAAHTALASNGMLARAEARLWTVMPAWMTPVAGRHVGQALAAVSDAALAAATGEAEAIRAAAQTRAERLLAAARTEAAELVAHRRAVAERLADAQEREQLARARAEAREAVLRAQESVLIDAADAARAAARRLKGDPRYEVLERRLAVEARERLSADGPVQIILCSQGGFVARAGSRQIDDSLDAQVDRSLEAMSGDMKALWGE
jgi:vacuolar-type H+-ATPase subunit E/Vma4